MRGAVSGLVLLVFACVGQPALAETPPPSSSPRPSPSPSAPPIDPRPAEAARQLIATTTLAERIAAQRQLAEAERAFLDTKIGVVRAKKTETVAKITLLEAKIAQRREVLDRVMTQAYRASGTSPLTVLLRGGSVLDALVHAQGLSAISAQERALIDELKRLETDLAAERDTLANDERDLAGLSEALAVKEAALARVSDRSGALLSAAAYAARVGGDGLAALREAELDVLRAMAEDAAKASAAADQLIAHAAAQSGTSFRRPDAWAWPAIGVVSQEFGPSALDLEPARTYKGVRYRHFHEGVDIAAPLGAPVFAASRGIVTFVGHLPDGAMVVIVAHDDRLVSMYAHLDDTTRRPRVRAGQQVERGDPLGFIGMTGITTGPHLHFVVRRDGEPVDPRSVLTARLPINLP